MRLTALELAECRLKASQGEDVAALASDIPALRALDLGWNELGDEGLRRLAEALRSMPQLQVLGIAGNGATHRGVFAVLAALPGAEVATGGSPADTEDLRLRFWTSVTATSHPSAPKSSPVFCGTCAAWSG